MSETFEHFLDRSLAHVVRFNSHPQHFPESVAEHSFFTSYFTMLILFFLKEAGEEVDEAKAMKIALVHDMEEVVSGDILTPFKHYNDEILKAIRKVNRDTIPLAFKNLPDNLSGELIALWLEDAEQSSKEGQIVKLADKISLISKCYEEVKAGNQFFQEIYDSQLAKLREIDHPWWKKIQGKILD